MKSLDIKGVSVGILTKLYDNAYDTIYKIINITKAEVLKLDGFKEKSAENLINALAEVKTKNCNQIMIASNLLGRGLGEKKLELILSHFPYICNDKKKAFELTVNDLKKVNGMGDISSAQFIENLHKFYDFYEELGMKIQEKQSSPKEEKKQLIDAIQGKHFVFTGFRNKDYETIIKDNQGFVDGTITKTTNYLIVKDKSKTTTKIEAAVKKGVILITKEEFEKMAKLN